MMDSDSNWLLEEGAALLAREKEKERQRESARWVGVNRVRECGFAGPREREGATERDGQVGRG